MQNASLYLRISQDRDGRQVAVERQEAECAALAERLGLSIAERYVDNDVSATKSKKRPDFERLLADTAQTKRPIIAWHQDRLLRLTRDLERVIDLNIPVYFVSSSDLDLATPAGRAVARTIAAWSQYEGEQKAVRQVAKNRQLALAGEPHKGRRLFGTDPGEADAVRELFDSYVNGESIAALAERYGRSHAGIRKLLSNRRFVGDRMYHGAVVADTGERIVDREMFDAAQERLSAAKSAREGLSVARKWLGSGLYLCSECGKPVKAGGGAVPSYRCRTCRLLRAGEPIDLHVEAVVRKLLADPRIAASLADAPSAESAEQIDADQRELALRYASGELDAAGFDIALSLIRARRDAASVQRGSVTLPPPEAFDEAPLQIKRSIVYTLVTVRLLRGRRGVKGFDPDSVRIEPKGAEE